MVEEVQVGDAPTEHVEHWKASERVASALKYTVLTFKKAFNTNNKRDILQRLEEVIHSMRPVIEGQTRANAEAAKWYLSLNRNFYKSTSPGKIRPLRSAQSVQVHQHPRNRLPISCRI